MIGPAQVALELLAAIAAGATAATLIIIAIEAAMSRRRGVR